MKQKKGEPFSVEGYSVPLNSRDKINQKFFLHITHDINEKKNILKKLRDAQKELKSITTMIPEIRLWSLTEKKKSINMIKRSSEIIKDSEDKYRNILENIQEGYFELDLNGNFVFFNNAFSMILGYSNEELIGLHYEKIMDSNAIKSFTQILEAFRRSNEFRETTGDANLEKFLRFIAV